MSAIDDLRATLKARADAEDGTTFMGWPDRWWEVFLRRCPDDHVSTKTLRTEEGDRCLACGQPVCMTFPEDVDGPLHAAAPTGGEG